MTLTADAESANGSATGFYFSSTGLLGVRTSGDGTFLPSALGAGLTSGSITGTSGGATAVASANLATGKVRGEANSDPFLGSDTAAESYDLLHWHVAGGGPALVTLKAHVDGTIAAGPGGAPFQDIFSLVMLSNVPGGSVQLQYTGDNAGFGPSNSGGVDTSGWQSHAYSNQSLTGFDFSGTYLVVDGETQSFFDELSLDCRLGSRCDFLNTAAISYKSLPGGVSFTSDSGVFLSDVAGSGAPEPATWALMLIGAGLAGASLRARGRAASA